MQLTDEQQQVIQAPVTHSLITAVAGSGKTTTLAWRILHLLDQGQDPRRLLVLMFNRAAKSDFEIKLSTLAADRHPVLPEIRTYHAMGLRLYRHFVKLGHLPAYRDPILNEQEIHWQLWLRIQQLAPQGMKTEMRRQKKELTELAANLLERSKTSLQTVDQAFRDLGIRKDLAFLKDSVFAFEEWRQDQQRLSFADMLNEPVQLMLRDPKMAQSVADKMDMVLVDEYQDTNEVQHALLQLIAGKRAQVTVVGDPDQTIYEFCGASPEFILSRFAQDFHQPSEEALTYSFRYGPKVALLANLLIRHNQGRKTQSCRAHPDNPNTQVESFPTGDTAHSVVRQIRAQQKKGLDLNNTAILFRVWSQAVPIELACLEAGIDYRIDQGKGALNDPNVIQLQHILGLADGRWAHWNGVERSQVLRGLLRFPHVGLKDDALQNLVRQVVSSPLAPGDALLDAMPAKLHGLQQFKLKRLARLLNQLPGQPGHSARVLEWYAEESELQRGIMDLALTREHGEERLSIVRQTIQYLKSLKFSPEKALAHFDDLAQRAQQQNHQQGLVLSTIHRAKGLEWDHVFLPGLSERYMPYRTRDEEAEEQEHLESERRLLYVALTRCRKSLSLFHPVPTQEKTKDLDDTPSRFLLEMQLIEKPHKKAGPQRNRFLFDA